MRPLQDDAWAEGLPRPLMHLCGQGGEMNCLMLGKGSLSPVRKRHTPGTENAEVQWVTLDIDPDCGADHIFDLNRIEMYDTPEGSIYGPGYTRLPLESNTFDEIHSYSVVAMYGKQGDYEGFFRGMRELWRVLKPGGLYIGGTPAPQDDWAWGDPATKRNINGRTWSYLTRDFYAKLGAEPLSDYRQYVEPCWWEYLHNTKEPVGDVSVHYWALKKV